MIDPPKARTYENKILNPTDVRSHHAQILKWLKSIDLGQRLGVYHCGQYSWQHVSELVSGAKKETCLSSKFSLQLYLVDLF